VKPVLVEEFVDSGIVRFVSRNLAFIGEESVAAAMAAECAGEQGLYWDYWDYATLLYESQNGMNEGAFSAAVLRDLGSRANADAEEFDACVDSSHTLSIVEADRAGADALDVDRTPGLVVKGQYFKEASDYSVLRPIIIQAAEAAATP
jgi:protein-disulfide isomerase